MTLEHAKAEALLRYQKSLDCIHCGICLSQCPTYEETGDEAASPRGRIHLMRGLAEGKLELNESFIAKMDLCLVCRACESVCPSAVDFSGMMEITREEIFRQRRGSRIGRYLMRSVIPDRRRLGQLAALTRFYSRSGLKGLVRGAGLRRLLPAALQRMEAQTPDVPPARERRPLEALYPAEGELRRGRVALLSGCVMEQLFGELNRRTVSALLAQGFEVVAPPAQTCCGALQAHAGDLETARELARRNIAVFEEAEIDWLVMNSAGCGAAVSDYPRWFADDPDWLSRARALAARTIDVIVLFERLALQPRGLGRAEPGSVAYDAPCHLHHAQGCTSEAAQVLSRVPGIELVTLEAADRCCGAAGLYSLQQPEMSDALLRGKIEALRASGARVLVTGNPGCILQWRRGIAEAGLAVQVRHPVEYL